MLIEMLGSSEAKRIENNDFRVQTVLVRRLARKRVDLNPNYISKPANTQKHGQFVYICMKCMSVEEK